MGLLSRRALAAFLLAASVVSCSDSTDGTSSPGGLTPTASREPTRIVPLGEAVRVSLAEARADLVLTLDAVEIAGTCPGRAAPVQSPQLGYFVILEVSASVQSPDRDLVVPLGAENFVLRDKEGREQAVTSTDASWACFEDAELLPPFVDTGGPVRGKVVLDSRTAEGFVTYRSAEPPWSWSWPFP